MQRFYDELAACPDPSPSPSPSPSPPRPPGEEIVQVAVPVPRARSYTLPDDIKLNPFSGEVELGSKEEVAQGDSEADSHQG